MNFVKVLKIYLSLVWIRKWDFTAFLVLLLISSGLTRLSPVFLGNIVDELTRQNFQRAEFIVVVLIGVRVFGGLLQNLKDHFGGLTLVTAHREAKNRYLGALQRMDYAYHTSKSSGSLISISKRGDGAIGTANVEINDRAMVLIVEFIVAIVFVATVNQTIGLIFLVTVILTLTICAFLIKLNIDKRKIANKADDAVTGVIVDNMVGFETVKIFAREAWELRKLDKAYIPWIKAYLDYFFTFRYIEVSVLFFSTIGISVALFYGVELLRSGQISLGQFTIIAGFIFALAQSMMDLVYKFRELAKTYTDLVNYFEIMELQPKIVDAIRPLKLERARGNISFRKVAFGYNGSLEVLQDINLDIKAGESIALVGKSGAGKTTLTKLVLRFYDVSQGAIFLDNVDIRKLQLENLRKQIGLVPQEAVLFNDTIAYNIGYALDNPSLEEVSNAAMKANLHDFVISLPEGYNTIVGERGIKLSGGQRQRLAIARVILENPAIVLFDEATSQLDSENEKQVQEAFKELTTGKTTLIIAHRLSTIMHADRIIVFDQGRVVEQGKHRELIAQKGFYARLWSLQTDGMIPE